jgi:hypothetical protein
MTKRIQTQLLTCAATVVATLLAGIASAQAPAATAQPTSMQTTLANDAGNLSDKFTGLARVMAGKYDWRPGAGHLGQSIAYARTNSVVPPWSK